MTTLTRQDLNFGQGRDTGLAYLGAREGLGRRASQSTPGSVPSQWWLTCSANFWRWPCTLSSTCARSTPWAFSRSERSTTCLSR